MIEKNYDQFWTELSVFYPISKGELRLPIASSVIPLNTLIKEEDIVELKNYLQFKIDNSSSEEIAKLLIQKGDNEIADIPFNGLNGVVRFDCMVDDFSGKLKVIEINSDYPDGFLLHDKTFSILLGTKSEKHENFLKSNFINNNYVFILYPENASFLDAYYSELELLKSLNINCGIGTVKDIKFENEYFWHGQNKISLIRRCCEVYKLPSDFFAKTKTKIFNTLHMRAFGYKDLLSEDKPFLLQSVSLSKENQDLIITEKNKWVLKPTNLSEGKGVVIGIDTNEIEWKKNVNEALEKGKFIVQEYLCPKKITLEYYDEARIKKDEFYFDICPHFLISNSKVVGTGHILMRFSKEKILNVTKGGAIGYGSF